MAVQELIEVDGWNAYVHLPSDYAQTSKNYPTIIFFPGLGEIGTDPNKVIQYGPGAYLKQGWNGETLGVKFIVISLQPTSAWPRSGTVKPKVDRLKSLYRIGDLYVTGLSMGGYCSTGLSMDYPGYVKGYVGVEPVCYYEKEELKLYARNVALSGQKYLLFEQVQDYRGCQILSDLMNAVVPGSATLQMTNFGGGGHCCWNEFYGGGGKQPGIFSLNGINQTLYEWVARQVLGVLPEFITKASLQGNELQWHCENVEDGDYFLIEKTTDFKAFDQIAKVPGAGNDYKLII